jgi:hypothetical protein
MSCYDKLRPPVVEMLEVVDVAKGPLKVVNEVGICAAVGRPSEESSEVVHKLTADLVPLEPRAAIIVELPAIAMIATRDAKYILAIFLA